MRTHYFQVQNGQFGLRIFLEKVMRMKSSRRWEKKKKIVKFCKIVKFICPRQPGKGTERERERETERDLGRYFFKKDFLKFLQFNLL